MSYFVDEIEGYKEPLHVGVLDILPRRMVLTSDSDFHAWDRSWIDSQAKRDKVIKAAAKKVVEKKAKVRKAAAKKALAKKSKIIKAAAKKALALYSIQK